MPKDIKKDSGMQGLIADRTLDEQIAYIERYESHGVPMQLRKRELWAAGLTHHKEKAENVVIFGCYELPRFPRLIPRYLRLLDALGIDYTFLDEEYCCGDPLIEMYSGEERRKGEKASREFMQKNISMAKAMGAKNLVYFCQWCYYTAKLLFPEGKEGHLYCPDVVVEKLRQRQLKVKPTAIGYFQGCHARGRRIAPQEHFRFAEYREILDRIKGLQVKEMNHKMCCVDFAPQIIEDAEKLGVDQIVTLCNACCIRLRDVAADKVEVRHYLEVLCDAVQIPA